MAVTRFCWAAALLVLTSGLSAPARAADSPVGVWMDDTGRGAIEISNCGDGKLCGRLVWLKDPNKSKACGTAIIGDVSKVGDSWDGGWIYSPEKESKYDVELTPQGADKLTVLGYAGTKLFSKEMTWTRAPADLPRCDVQEAKATTGAGGSTAAAAATGPATATPPAGAAERKAGEPKAGDGPAGSETRTAQADVDPPRGTATAGASKKKPAPRRKMCRVDAPFVTVEFPCDDD